MKPFYLIGAAAVAIGAAAAMTVFAADPAPAAKPAPPMVKAASVKGDAGKGEHKMRMEAPTFAEIDSNHDGSISQAEFDAFRAAHKPGMGDGGREGGMHPGMMGPEGRGWGPPMMRMNRHFGGGRGGEGEGLGGMGMHGERALDLLDTNSDGKLSFDELIAPLKRHFDRMDTNHDGTLSSDELQKGHGKFERPMPPPAGQ